MGNMNFGHASTNFGHTSSNFEQASRVGMLGFEMDDRSPPLVISSVNPDASQLEQLRQQNEPQQQQLQRHQEFLIQQQELLQAQMRAQMQRANLMNMNIINGAGMSIPMQVGSHNFSLTQDQHAPVHDGEKGDLENYLSNLDLSNL